MEQVPLDDHIQIITGPIFTKVIRLAYGMLLSQLAGLIAEIGPLVCFVKGFEVFGEITVFGANFFKGRVLYLTFPIHTRLAWMKHFIKHALDRL